VGSKGFADFFKYYYGAITQVFGKTRSDAVKAAVDGGKSVQKRMPGQNTVEYTSEKNATEHVAQALGRMGKRVAEYFGLGRSQSNKFLSYANIWQVDNVYNLGLSTALFLCTSYHLFYHHLSLVP
ncbi:MAG: hypothetical protein II206_08835, partial [Bacteroidaceae bacterium]|nr:hypothetical protein [Bacteroidaceae bacterium]